MPMLYKQPRPRRKTHDHFPEIRFSQALQLVVYTGVSIMGFTYLAISLFGSHYYLKQVQTQVHQHIADTLVQDHHLVEQGRVNQDALATTFKRYMLLNPYLEIYLVNRNGQVLQYSADDKKILRRHIDMTPLLTALSKPSDADRPFPMGDDPRKATGQAPFSVAALPDGLFLYVIIRNSVEQEANRQLQESLLLELSAWSFLVSLLVGLILGGGVFLALDAHASYQLLRLTSRSATSLASSVRVRLTGGIQLTF